MTDFSLRNTNSVIRYQRMRTVGTRITRGFLPHRNPRRAAQCHYKSNLVVNIAEIIIN